MRPWKCIAGAAGLLPAAVFRAFPAFAALWHARVSRPFAALAASLSERLPFPLLEPLGFALILCAAAGFCRGWKKGLTRLTAIASALLAVYALAWLPGYFVPTEQIWMENAPDMATAPGGLFPPGALYSADSVSMPGTAQTRRELSARSASAEQPCSEATASAEASSQASPTSSGAEAPSGHRARSASAEQPCNEATVSAEASSQASPASNGTEARSMHRARSASAEQPCSEATASAEASSQASPTSSGAEAPSGHRARSASAEQPCNEATVSAEASSQASPASNGTEARSMHRARSASAEQPDASTVSAPGASTSSSARYSEFSAESALSPAVDLEALCLRLIGELNASTLRFTGGESALLQAVEAMNAAFGAELGGNAVRFARYPEWMAALDLAGFYSPWTGEALVSPNLSAAALPFTACHELAHRLGIADEGVANIAAWIACRQSGGELADSAALWALRYAMAELRASDEAAWRHCAQEMRPALVRAFASMNGFSEMPGVARRRFFLRGADSYAALLPWLIEHPEAWE